MLSWWCSASVFLSGPMVRRHRAFEGVQSFLEIRLHLRLRVVPATGRPRFEPCGNVFGPIANRRVQLQVFRSQTKKPPAPDGRHGQTRDARHVMFSHQCFERSAYHFDPFLGSKIRFGSASVRIARSEAMVFTIRAGVSEGISGCPLGWRASSRTVRTLGLLAVVIYSAFNDRG
jgi:hypothetical protein